MSSSSSTTEELEEKIKNLNVHKTASWGDDEEVDYRPSNLTAQQSDPNNPLFGAQSFEELNLKPELLQGVYAMKYNKPSNIQSKSLPIILNEPTFNLIAQSQSGTGKTACFGLGMLSFIDENVNSPQALCLCPTLELAQQIYEVVTKLSKFTKIKVATLQKGMTIRTRITDQILIGTPGKIQDLLKKKLIDASKLKMYVIDEADQMLEVKDNQSMFDTCRMIKKMLPASVRVLLFSATYAEDDLLGEDEALKAKQKEEKIIQVAREIVPEPLKLILVPKEALTISTMKQFFVVCESDQQKMTVLKDVYEELSVGQSIIFMNRRETAAQLCNGMRQDGFQVSMLTGTMDPEDRRTVISEFKKANTKVLISTNVLSRGLDIATVTHVINYDLPVLHRSTNADFATYLHRIGRTARFGRSGFAINLVTPRELHIVKQLEEYFKIEIQKVEIDELSDKIK